jgi:hypothetical protein
MVRCDRLIPAGVLGSLLLAGCSAKPTDKTVVLASGTGPPAIVDVALGDFFFQSADTIPAGKVLFRLNLKSTDAHVMDLVRLENGKRLADLLAAGEDAFDSTWVKFAGGGITSVSDTRPTYAVTLTPGVYVMLCYFTAPDHQPHFAKGMIKEVIVRPAEPVEAPAMTPDIDVQLVDFAFQVSKPLTAGVHTIRVTNPSAQAHEVVLSRLKDGVTLEQARARADSANPKGPPIWEAYGGVGDLAPGDTIVMTARFTPGHYQMRCMFQNKGETMNHSARGMQLSFTVD